MRDMMWIYATIVLWVSETWSLEPGTNQSISVNSSSTTLYSKLSVTKMAVFDLGIEAKLTCGNKTWNKMMYVIWELQLQDKECKIAFDNDGRSQNNCSDGKSLQNTSDFQSYLHIPEFSTNDRGTYKCESVYTGGSENYVIDVSHTGQKVETTEKAEGFLWLCIPTGAVTLVFLVGFFIFAQKKVGMLRQCWQSDDSPSKSSPTEDVEEVEPYASYVQRVNSIYNSSAENSAHVSHAHT